MANYVVTVTAEQGSTNIFGLPVSAMQSNVIVENNGFTGELKYLTEEDINDTWKQAWPEELQTGNFIALKFEVPEGPQSVKVGFVNGTPLVEIINDPDRNGVFRVKSTSNIFKVVVDNDDENAQLYNFENITLDSAPQPEPVKPGYMNENTPLERIANALDNGVSNPLNPKIPLERIADALEGQIGTPSEDKGMLAEKDYLERVAIAVENGAGQGGGGSKPTGEIQIIENGVVDVTNYASANVNVPGYAPNECFVKIFNCELSFPESGAIGTNSEKGNEFANLLTNPEYENADFIFVYTSNRPNKCTGGNMGSINEDEDSIYFDSGEGVFATLYNVENTFYADLAIYPTAELGHLTLYVKKYKEE